MINIYPSVLTNDVDELVSLVQKSASAERLHVDIIDGRFADNVTIVPEDMTQTNVQSVVDFHLMVDEPVDWISRCKEGGADRVVAQIEKMLDIETFVDEVIEMIGSVGLAFDIESEATKIPEKILGKLDAILLMSVKAGFGGQEFHESVLQKISHFAKLKLEKGYKYIIGVDGGINETNIAAIVQAGADEVSIGRLLFKGDVAANIEKLKKEVHDK